MPLTVLESALQSVVLLPRLPALVRENAALRGQLAAQQLELMRARETLRRTTRTAALKQDTSAGAAKAVRAERSAGTGEGAGAGVTASILIPPMLPTQHMVTLDRGARAGLVLESILVGANGLVGRVTDVYPTTSVAMLLTDPNSRIACRIERSREIGLLAGSGESRCRLMYLDVEADVVVGDQVVTAGLGGSIPNGLPVGVVTSVVSHPHESPEVWVKPAVTLSQLEEVLCVPPVAGTIETRNP